MQFFIMVFGTIIYNLSSMQSLLSLDTYVNESQFHDKVVFYMNFTIKVFFILLRCLHLRSNRTIRIDAGSILYIYDTRRHS